MALAASLATLQLGYWQISYVKGAIILLIALLVIKLGGRAVAGRPVLCRSLPLVTEPTHSIDRSLVEQQSEAE